MHRLVQSVAFAGDRVDRAERSRGQHAQGTGQHRRAIGQHVAEQVIGDDDVELLGIADQLHGAVVGEHIFVGQIGAFGGVQGGHRLAPQHAGHHDIGFFHRGHAALTFTCQVEGDTADPLNLRGGVEIGVKALAGAVGQVFDTARLREINAAGQFTQDQDIETGDQFAL